MSRSIKTLADVVDWGLCIGCGACQYACKHRGISLVDIPDVGIRPQFELPECASCTDCLSICPGYQLPGNLVAGRSSAEDAQLTGFGKVLEIWEGHAADPEIRHQASSGGLLSALSLYCIEREEMGFVLHSGMDEDKPWLNRTMESRNRADLLAKAGSRYAPASPCDRLQAIEDSEKPCVFIGKPCDSAAVMMLREQRPQLAEKLGLVLTFFCAGTPSTTATLALLEELGISPEQVDALRYRGDGWPGGFKVLFNQRREERFVGYMKSWGDLARRRPFRCHLCPDGLGRLADLSCGDAWEEYSENGNPGLSIVLVRSERGREVLHRAIGAGYVKLRRIGVEEVLQAQVNLLQRRKQIFGRLLAMKLLCVPIPKFSGFNLWDVNGA